MKLSIKAAMFSAIVFPGAGYFVVDRKVRGIAALIVTISILIFMMRDIFYRANIIADKIVYGVIPYDIASLREQILLTPGQLSQELMTNLSLVIALIWIVSIIDAYFVGRRIEATKQM